MENVIILAILVVIIGFAARYVYKAKKGGRKCIGCPDGSCNCSSSGTENTCSCGCCGTGEAN